MRALRDGAGHALRGCHRRAARRRELVGVVPRRVLLLAVDVLADVVLHVLLQLHVLLAALTFVAIMFCCLEASWLATSSSWSIEIINVIDFRPLESSVHVGCLDCKLLKATIEMAVASPAATGRACRSLSESFGALEASLREASNAPSMAPRRHACPECDASECRTGGSGLPCQPPLPTWLMAVFHLQVTITNITTTHTHTLLLVALV